MNNIENKIEGFLRYNRASSFCSLIERINCDIWECAVEATWTSIDNSFDIEKIRYEEHTI